MKILVVNCGSSSLKYQLIDMETEEVMAKGYLERIGLEDSFLTHTVKGEKHRIEKKIANHEEGIKLVIEQLLDKDYGVIKDLSEIDAVGHRIVHGGEKFSKSVVITDEVENTIKECIPLAPLHNPAGITGIEACKKALKGVPMVAVFDTAFHQTLPKKAYMYAIPYEYYEKYGVRKYGFHGTSHRFVSKRVAEVMGKPVEDLKIIACHLGQGASLCAIDGGKSIETTMGLTPLAGVPMGSRSGDIDPSILPPVMEAENKTIDDIINDLNKHSGILGMSGISSDMRDLEAACKKGNERAILTMKKYVRRITDYIAQYYVLLGGADVIAFTAGVGENSSSVRKMVCDNLVSLGIKIDEKQNNVHGKTALISTPDSKIKVYVIPTDEELMIARDTLELIK